MLDDLRVRLRRRLASGFWFPPFVASLVWLRENASLARHFELWLADGGQEPRGGPEFYQFVLTIVLIVWTILLRQLWLPFLSTAPARVLGLVIVIYWATELFVFALHWAFAASGAIASGPRSLAAFLHESLAARSVDANKSSAHPLRHLGVFLGEGLRALAVNLFA